MQTIQDVMTRDVKSISPEDTVRRAAEMMKDLDVGAIPVCDGNKLVGMITDRDITIRSTAAGQAPGTHPRRRRHEHRRAHLLADADGRRSAGRNGRRADPPRAGDRPGVA